MLAYGGGILFGEGQSDFVVVFPQLDVHGAFGLTDVRGCAWVVGVASAWCVVHQFVDVRNGVLEVDELGEEGVLVARDDAHISLAEGPANDFGGAAVVRKGDDGFVFGRGC
jgi:hypothetical protein